MTIPERLSPESFGLLERFYIWAISDFCFTNFPVTYVLPKSLYSTGKVTLEVHKWSENLRSFPSIARYLDKIILCAEHGHVSIMWVLDLVVVSYIVLVFTGEMWQMHMLFGNGWSQILYTVYRMPSNYMQKPLNSIVYYTS